PIQGAWAARVGAARPRVGRGGEPQHAATPAPEAAGPVVPHTPRAGGGRFRAAQTPHVWHGAHRSGTPPARRPAPGPRGRHVRAKAPAPPWPGSTHTGP